METNSALWAQTEGGQTIVYYKGSTEESLLATVFADLG